MRVHQHQRPIVAFELRGAPSEAVRRSLCRDMLRDVTDFTMSETVQAVWKTGLDIHDSVQYKLYLNVCDSPPNLNESEDTRDLSSEEASPPRPGLADEPTPY